MNKCKCYCSFRKGQARVLIISRAVGSKNMCWGWHLSIQPECHSCQVFLPWLPRQPRFQCSNLNHFKEQSRDKAPHCRQQRLNKKTFGSPATSPFNLISKQHSCNSLQVTRNSCRFSARLKPSPPILNNLQA